MAGNHIMVITTISLTHPFRVTSSPSLTTLQSLRYCPSSPKLTYYIYKKLLRFLLQVIYLAKNVICRYSTTKFLFLLATI